MSEIFIPMVAPADAAIESVLWFAFQGSQLLVRKEDLRAELPKVRDLEEIGLLPLRRQYLGRLGEHHCFSAECEGAAPEGMNWAGLRSLFGMLDDRLFAIAGRAIQIMDWDRTHLYCGRCGTPTVVKVGERARVCPSCEQTHYPRIAPAVMALVRRGKELLLARSPHFAPGMYSALAGFVEPGESLEECLRREVKEEVGIEVGNLQYFASQPWPFPHSLMIAFNCDYAGGEIMPDPAEIESAAWFTLEHLPTLPNPISISRKLINATIERMKADS
jgi:NAD+ diphosphatase